LPKVFRVESSSFSAATSSRASRAAKHTRSTGCFGALGSSPRTLAGTQRRTGFRISTMRLAPLVRTAMRARSGRAAAPRSGFTW
jgi:hypothetical protein